MLLISVLALHVTVSCKGLMSACLASVNQTCQKGHIIELFFMLFRQRNSEEIG